MKFNIDKRLRLQIRGKLVIAFAGFSILPVLIVGILGISWNVQTLRRVAIEDLNHDLIAIKERIGSFLQNTEENIELLTATSSFQRFVSAAKAGDDARVAKAQAALLPELLSFARRKGIFYQIKYIGADGNELFVIEHDGQEYHPLNPNQLNVSGTSFYLYLANKMPPNAFTFIPVELIGRGSKALLPGISCLYPVYSGKFSGLLVFQIYAQAFFRIMEQKTPHTPTGIVMLVNSEGYYLYHSEKKKAWNRLLASKDVSNLEADYGEEVAVRLLGSSSPSIQEVGDELVAHAPLFPDYRGLENDYTILKSVSKKEIFAPANTFKKLFYGLLGIFLLISLLFAYLGTQQFTGPIQKLRREAEVIARGDYHSRVDVETYDEIGELARQFNVMAESLEQRETEIAQHQQHLEQVVRQRTRELEKEKNKLQVILDNVPSGFMLVDKDLRVISASAAIESIIGKPLRDILGHFCFEATRCHENEDDCPSRCVFQSGRPESYLLQRLGPEGEEQYLEQIAIPLKKDGKVETILEILTDVTKRKRLQQQLIRSERLAATGEIAAVIAHEMRNSLTSVRMILQLLREADRLMPSDTDSLNVALDSIGRMENVVKDLLQLARPSPLEKRPGNIITILKESIEFTRHQILRQGIELEVDLTPDLPEVELDHHHLKEAVVNLILNASQAIETTGKIHIRSRLTTLSQNLRDLGEVRIAEDEKVGVGVQEVVLRKGQRTIKVDIMDSGIGMSDEEMQRIFNPFYTTKPKGTGLGLSFVKRVVNAHGGLVKVASQVGKGSQFSIFIPA
ncbi:MAG: ATP-binding protein [bacterium]